MPATGGGWRGPWAVLPLGCGIGLHPHTRLLQMELHLHWHLGHLQDRASCQSRELSLTEHLLNVASIGLQSPCPQSSSSVAGGPCVSVTRGRCLRCQLLSCVRDCGVEPSRRGAKDRAFQQAPGGSDAVFGVTALVQTRSPECRPGVWSPWLSGEQGAGVSRSASARVADLV